MGLIYELGKLAEDWGAGRPSGVNREDEGRFFRSPGIPKVHPNSPRARLLSVNQARSILQICTEIQSCSHSGL
jgi:hypothetical protein